MSDVARIFDPLRVLSSVAIRIYCQWLDSSQSQLQWTEQLSDIKKCYFSVTVAHVVTELIFRRVRKGLRRCKTDEHLCDCYMLNLESHPSRNSTLRITCRSLARSTNEPRKRKSQLPWQTYFIFDLFSGRFYFFTYSWNSTKIIEESNSIDS